MGNELGAYSGSTEEFAEPVGEVELQVAGIWMQVLGIDRVGRHDNFFELGGHELLLTKLHVMIRDAFAVELPLRVLFESLTVATMASAIERAR